MKKRTRHHLPRVAILLESSHGVSRGMLRGVLRYVRLYGPWELNLASGGADDQKLPDRATWHGNGIIARVPNAAAARDIAAARLPTVLIDPIDAYLAPACPLSRFSRMVCDSRRIGDKAAEYLLARGFKSFGYIGTPLPVNWEVERRDGFLERLRQNGSSCSVYPPPPPALAADFAQERPRLASWLRSLSQPAAVFAANDSRARQVLTACLAARIPVPYRIAVLGVNNDEIICETSLPSLSSIGVDAERAGFEAAAILDRLMSRTLRKQVCQTFGPLDVVSRDSTRPLQVSDPLVIAALEFIRINAGLNLRAADVAAHLRVTPRWLEKRIGAALGKTLIEEIQEVRLATVKALVADSNLPFTDIAKRCGFTSANHLGVLFRTAFGATMTAYRAARSPGA